MQEYTRIFLTSLLVFCAYHRCIASEEMVYSQLNGDINLGIVRQIAQEDSGLIWIASSTGFYTFDGYEYHPIVFHNQKIKNARVIYIDTKSIWLGSSSSGLYQYRNGKLEKQQISHNNKSMGLFAIYKDEKSNVIWFGSDKGLFYLKNKTYHKIDFFEDLKIISIAKKQHYLYVATDDRVFSYNSENNKVKDLFVHPNLNKSAGNHVLYKDPDGILWLGRNDGLYKLHDLCHCFKAEDNIFNNKEVVSLAADGVNLWIGTLFNGIYKYAIKTKSYMHFQYDVNKPDALVGNNIKSILVAKNNLIWYGTFRDGIGFLNAQSSQFGRVTKANKLMKCALSNVVYRVLSQNDKEYWIATENGLIYSNEDHCKIINSLANETNQLSHSMVHSLMMKDDKTLWIGTVKGLNRLNIETQNIKQLNSSSLQQELDIIQIISLSENKLLLGTDKGLFSYAINNNHYESITDKYNLSKDAVFYNYAKDLNGNIYWGTTKGLAVLANNANLSFITLTKDPKAPAWDITALVADKNGGLWFAADNKYLYYLSKDKVLNDFTVLLNKNNVAIMSMILKNQNLWMASDSGLFKLDLITHKIHFFSENDGLQSQEFQRASKFVSKTGMIYFGGKKGFNHFFPENISQSYPIPEVLITGIKQLNQDLGIGEKMLGGYEIKATANYIDELTLTHKDYIIDLKFAALDYLHASHIQYAYRLLGFQQNWVYADAGNRQATFTNLKPGKYIFQVKAANKNGIWSDKPKELRVVVNPAPWFSPWAYAVYIILILLSIWVFIRYRTVASRKRAIELEKTVAIRTQEVKIQKKMVESLLDHKNEVFANITHEFKTPISLILGPIKELAADTNPQNADRINMIQRNAKRLMLMVGQILKLSQCEQDKEVIRESQAIQPILLMLFESFSPLAQNKNINLILDNQHDVNIYATSDCLEMVVGNLLSNAIKFSSIGSEVKIQTQVINNSVLISIEDTGSGIQEKDLDKIFSRFTRLETHKSIAGTGIGLSVVKEVTEANNGSVTVQSQWGSGTTFTLKFPISDMKAVDELSQDMVDQLVDNTANELLNIETAHQHKFIRNRATILIIEDNLDMQTHIGNILHSFYNCLFADRGKAGIALALKEVPDIVICDVMMPGMDGYQVTRILRHDNRTSHIPIILLTALNTKESRIKGWRENIDTYITKPFDATELKVQLQNILNIRKLLQQKTNKAIKNNTLLSTLDLCKKDMEFIEKFKDVIAQLYNNENIQKADIAAKMAVSERQLQRKIHALIDENPMNMLRDYRLEKAAMKLKDGYHVGIVSDSCGFRSPSYFGSCFKKKYGVTPKQYQQSNYN